MKTTTTLSKQEIEEAVKLYLEDRINAGYKFVFDEPTLSFHNKDGDIGFFECLAESGLKDKEDD